MPCSPASRAAYLATRKLGRRASVRIRLLDDGDEAETVSVPASALRLFLHLLTEMSQGNAVTLIPDPRGTDHPASCRPAQRLAALRRQAARRGKNPVPHRRQIPPRPVRRPDGLQTEGRRGPSQGSRPAHGRSPGVWGWATDGPSRHRRLRREHPCTRPHSVTYSSGSHRLGLVRGRWTETIHDEWVRNVLKDNPALSPDRLARTRALMNEAVRDCLVIGYENLIESLALPDPTTATSSRQPSEPMPRSS